MRRIALAACWLCLWGGPLCAQPMPKGQPVAGLSPEVGGKPIEYWIKEIEDRDPSVRENAIKMVALLGPQGKKAVPALIRQLQSPNDLSPMTNAAIAIGAIQPDEPQQLKSAVFNLIQLLGSSQGIIRFQAAMALGNLGPPARNAIGPLASRIKDAQSWEIRKAAAFALGRIGVDDKNIPDMRALTALADGIDDAAKEVRIEALQGLITLGPPPTLADQQQLKLMLEKRIKVDKDKYVGIWVRVALMRMDASSISDANIDYIAAHLKSTDPAGINADAARALGAMGAVSHKKVGDLMKALESSDPSLVAWSAWALGNIGNDSKAALPRLQALVDSASDQGVKQSAADAIKKINNPKKP